VSTPTVTGKIVSVTVVNAGGRKGRATIVVRTTAGASIPGATVTGTWTGALSGTQSAVTNSSGSATITSARGTRGTATFTTTKVVLPAGFTWDGVNKAASASIT
jgi:hypothetical protein